MKQVFRIKEGFIVPDGTKIYPFLNAKDSMSSLPFDLLDGFSIAAGEIFPGTQSKIHIHPLITQVTFVLKGKIDIYMKGDTDSNQYLSKLKEQEAVLTSPGTFFQLVNSYNETCRVLYIVCPDYLFEMSGDQILYNDAIVLDEGWDELARLNWEPPTLLNSNITPESRQAAYERIKRRKIIQ